MYLVDDYVSGRGNDRQWACRKGTAAASLIYPDAEELILCHVFFKLGVIEGASEEGRKGHVRQVTCDDLNHRISRQMKTMGTELLHEYTHNSKIVSPIIGAGLPRAVATEDHVYGFEKCRGLNKDLATTNADSYALFATEMFWSTKCDRDFEPPKPKAEQTSKDKLTGMLLWLGVEPTERVYAAAAGKSVDETLVALGLFVRPRPIPADDECAEADRGAEMISNSADSSAAKEDLDAIVSSSVEGGSASKGGSAAKREFIAEGTSSAEGTLTTNGASTATGTISTKGPSSLYKRALFSRPYEHPIPDASDLTYTLEQRDKMLEAHIEALHLCSVVIDQATRNPDRFDKVFRAYFNPGDRELVLSKYQLQWTRRCGG
jgi:hypothetical protein